MTTFNPAEPRDHEGKWTSGAMEAAMRGLVQQASSTGRAKVQTPSQFRHPSTGHAMGKTEIGDTFEQLDMQTGTVSVFAYRGFVSKAVSQMEKVGSYSFTQEDFRRAQIRTGHWEQRHARAGRA